MWLGEEILIIVKFFTFSIYTSKLTKNKLDQILSTKHYYLVLRFFAFLVFWFSISSALIRSTVTARLFPPTLGCTSLFFFRFAVGFFLPNHAFYHDHWIVKLLLTSLVFSAWCRQWQRKWCRSSQPRSFWSWPIQPKHWSSSRSPHSKWIGLESKEKVNTQPSI